MEAWPQVVLLALSMVDLGIVLGKNGEARTSKYSFGVTLCSTLLLFGLLYAGGFWAPLVRS